MKRLEFLSGILYKKGVGTGTTHAFPGRTVLILYRLSLSCFAPRELLAPGGCFYLKAAEVVNKFTQAFGKAASRSDQNYELGKHFQSAIK